MIQVLSVSKKCEDKLYNEGNDSCDEPVKEIRNKCEHCGKYFNNLRGLRIHVAKTHLI